MKTIIKTLVGVLLSLTAFGQQDESFSQYFFNPMFVNPAYAGSRDVFSGTLVHRSQWIGLEGAPVTSGIGVHSAIPNTNLGAGLLVMGDKAGPLRNTSYSAILSYHLRVGEKYRLSFGLGGMLSSVRLDYDALSIQDGTDESFMNNTPTTLVPDANAGLYLYSERFYAGASVRHLVQTRVDIKDETGINMSRFKRHYYLNTGVVIPLDDNVDLRPSLMMRYVEAAPAMFDINAHFIFYDQLFVGAGLRTGKRIDIKGMDNILILSAEYDFKNRLRLGYSFDAYLNRMGNYRFGTHEIMLGWDLSFSKTKLASPRYF
jgi:type IX secretion system PorP/SprF family membrane protein